jgi:hypothetical membrane protein
MAYSNGKVAGTLIFIAVAQFVLALTISEALYSGYSISGNYISDLGVGPSSNIFNSSIFLLGLLIIIGTYLLQSALKEYKLLTMMLILTAIGAMGVGVFTENFAIIHKVMSAIVFLFGGLSAIFSVICSHIHKFKLVKMPFSAVAVILGLMSLAPLALFAGKIDLGLGPGGMERMIAYQLLMWGAGFGGYLIAHPEERNWTDNAVALAIASLW